MDRKTYKTLHRNARTWRKSLNTSSVLFVYLDAPATVPGHVLPMASHWADPTRYRASVFEWLAMAAHTRRQVAALAAAQLPRARLTREAVDCLRRAAMCRAA